MHLPFRSFAISMGLALPLWAAAPVVSDISASQRAGTNLVDITYNVTADTPTVKITLQISANGGTTWAVPATTVSGAIGSGVSTGTGKMITWNAGTDWPGQFSAQTCFRVFADDLGLSYIPAGSFTMGNSMSADKDITNAPAHTVTVSEFYMGKNLVTWAEYQEINYWVANNSGFGYGDLTDRRGVWVKSESHPVDKVAWWDAVKYCNARSQKEGLSPVYMVGGAVMNMGFTAPTVNWTANGYRLPTEAEWEKAARGGLIGKRFPWGDTISKSQANYFGDTSYSYDLGPVGYHLTYATGSTPYTSPVGRFPANSYGLYDMAGNVRQWCWDFYGSYDTASPLDPRGAISGTDRVRRGGSWTTNALNCRSAHRENTSPSDWYGNDFGFRVVRSSLDSQFPPTITAKPASPSITSGQMASLTVTAAGTAPLTYQWYEGNAGSKTTPVGTNSATFSTPALSTTTSYWVRVSNVAGSVESSAATVTVVVLPAITSQPASLSICSEQKASLTVTATSAAPLSYQWYQGSAGITTTPVGINSALFTTPELSTPTNYWVRVSNMAGSVDSSAATVTILPAPPVVFSLIPSGSFTMGNSIAADTGMPDAPSHTVTVSAFYMAKNLVTWAEYQAVKTWAASNGYTDFGVSTVKAATHPVQTISWWDAVKYCNARSQKDGLTPVYTAGGAVMKTGTTAPTVNWTANGYRLPTEAEWEKAARGGLIGKRFPWGDTISQSQANYHGDTSYSYDLGPNGDHPTYAVGLNPYTSPVGSFPANGYGLYDMAGNVWQWCWDYYANYDTASPTNPRGPISGAGRVLRGGSWDINGAPWCRSAHRHKQDPSYPGGGVYGFRVARSSIP